MANDEPGSATTGWHGFGATDTGLVRARNEDAFAADLYHASYLVADGLGGLSGGDVARALARRRLAARQAAGLGGEQVAPVEAGRKPPGRRFDRPPVRRSRAPRDDRE